MSTPQSAVPAGPFPRCLLRISFRILLVAGLLGWLGTAVRAAEAPADDKPEDLDGDVTTMAAFNVKDNRLEDFGFRISRANDPTRSSGFWSVVIPVVDVVLPNTAAAKAGMRPGDRVVTADGQSTAGGFFTRNKWRGIQEKKWAEVAAGKQDVVWTLELEPFLSKERRTVKLTVPTPAPHWGSSVWQAPKDRIPAMIPETGPLAERARQVLDNGVWILLRASYMRGANLRPPPGQTFYLCYTWTLWSEGVGHRMYASQQSGWTEIILETILREAAATASKVAPAGGPNKTLASTNTVFATHSRAFLTTPSGKLERSWTLSGGDGQPSANTLTLFEQEKEFWLKKVGKVSPRWPLEVIPVKAGDGAVVAGASTGEGASMEAGAAKKTPTGALRPVGERAKEFLQLPAASAEQRTLFTAALGKLGADEDRWAYTEAARTPEDRRVMVKRVDPSKPEAKRVTLVSIDGKKPTEEETARWRDEGRDGSAGLGALPPLDGLVDLDDVRVLKEEATALTFELPLRGGNAQFPAEKFQATFRVNKASRGFEEIAIKLRDGISVAGIAKISEAGIAMKFESLDPAMAPQPVLLRGGGAIRVALLVKIARDFEMTRSDFKRVEPFVDGAAPEK